MRKQEVTKQDKTEWSTCTPSTIYISGENKWIINFLFLLHRQAKIPVKKLSGYAKGYGCSPDRPFSTDLATNHAWNAVFVRGNWFLLDSTWGAGILGKDKKFEARFDEFYFLTDAECFALSHFPHFHEAPNESLKWQLLEKPLSLETFNRLLDIRPAAYSVGLFPLSHRDVIIKFNDEIELTFKEEIPKSIRLSTELLKDETNILEGQDYCCYAYWSKGYVKVTAIPPVSGIYRLQILGRDRSTGADENMPLLFEYKLHCNTVSKGNASRKFPLPDYYPQAFVDECQVLEPLGKQIPPETEIKMRFQSPVLKRMMINKKLLEKEGDIFEGKAMSPKSGHFISVYGSRSDSGSLDKLYVFAVA